MDAAGLSADAVRGAEGEHLRQAAEKRGLEIAERLAWHTRPVAEEDAIDPETERFEAWSSEMPGVRFAAKTGVEALHVCTMQAARAIAQDLLAGRKPVKPLYDSGRTTIVPVRVTAEELADIDAKVAIQRKSGRKIGRGDVLREEGVRISPTDAESLGRKWEQARQSGTEGRKQK